MPPKRLLLGSALTFSLLAGAEAAHAQSTPSLMERLPTACPNVVHLRRIDATLGQLATAAGQSADLFESLGWPADRVRKLLLRGHDAIPREMALAVPAASIAALATWLQIGALADVLVVYQQRNDAENSVAKALRARLINLLASAPSGNFVAAVRTGSNGEAAEGADFFSLLGMEKGELVVVDSVREETGSRAETKLWQFGPFLMLAEKLSKLGIQPDARLRLRARCSVYDCDTVWEWSIEGGTTLAVPAAGPEAATSQAALGILRADLAAAQTIAKSTLEALEPVPDAIFETLASVSIGWLSTLLELPRRLNIELQRDATLHCRASYAAAGESEVLAPSLRALTSGAFAGYVVGGNSLDAMLCNDVYASALSAERFLAPPMQTAFSKSVPLLPNAALVQLQPLMEWLFSKEADLFDPGWALLLGEPTAAPRISLTGAEGEPIEALTPRRMSIPALAIVGRPRSPDAGWAFAERTSAALLQSLQRRAIDLVATDLGLGAASRELPWAALFGDEKHVLSVAGDARLHWFVHGDLLVFSTSVTLSKAILATKETPADATSWRSRAEMPSTAIAAQVAALFSILDNLEHGEMHALAQAMGLPTTDIVDRRRLRAAWSTLMHGYAGWQWRSEVGDTAIDEELLWPYLVRR